MQSDETNHLETTELGRSVRTHVLTKAINLKGDIASLGDPKISHFYQLLTTELKEPSRPGKQIDIADHAPSNENNQKHEIEKMRAAEPSLSDVAVYVHNITHELKELCLGVDLKFLAYLIDMAHVEANNISAKQPKS